MFPFRQYTSGNELANSNVHDIIHDARGNLWFATDRGVSRFDGFKFSDYLYKEGLPASEISCFAENDSNVIIAAGHNDAIVRFGNNFHPFIPAIKGMANDRAIWFNNLWYSLQINDHITTYQPADKKESIVTFGDPTIRPLCMTIYQHAVYVGTNKGLYRIISDTQTEFVDAFGSSEILSAFSTGDRLYLGAHHTLYVYSGEHTTAFETPGSVTHILVGVNGIIWFSTAEDGALYRMENGAYGNDLSERLMTGGIAINKIYEDTEGNIWIATAGKGVYCLHHFYNTNFTGIDGLPDTYITALSADANGNICIGTQKGLCLFNGEKIILPKDPVNCNVRSVHMQNGQITVWFNSTGVRNFDPGIKQIGTRNIHYFPDQQTAGGRSLWLTVHSGTFLSPDLTEQLPDAPTCMYTDAKNVLWVGTHKGLFRLQKNSSWEQVKGIPGKGNISAMCGSAATVYVGGESGIYAYDLRSGAVTQPAFGKNIDNVTALTLDGNERLWIGTLTGLFLWSEETLLQFDTRNVLVSDEIHALVYDEKNDDMWAGSSFGLSRIDIRAFLNTPIHAPVATFKNLRSADSIYRDLDTYNDLILPHRSGSFTLRFSAIHFSTPEGVRFYYKFDDADWELATGRQIEFASLPYGKHVILLKAEGERKHAGPVATLTLTVKTPFWATNWFKIAVIALLLFSIAWIIRKRFDLLRKKQQEKLEVQARIAELRHQALSASMNPHFIFNALNSIQQFINVHDTHEASEYLGKFARLIRIMLDAGSKTFITLQEETERLQYYLELEKIRFGNKLNYSIDIDPSLDLHMEEIPNMVIQPIVENALWHGLLPLNRPGTLTVQFKRSGKGLSVIIDDNGMGVKASAAAKQKDHNSLGIRMIRERFEMLNRLSGYTADIQLFDKSEEGPGLSGTRVEIHFGKS
ncbi:MAG: two-component regulator propeller domain-containing protein [Chitinophagales bacterium]